MSRELSKKKIYWGKSTWQLFHTMAEKIDEIFYQQSRYIILDMIKKICTTLPCPDCARHAAAFMRNVHPDSVPNKREFRAMLFVFHNRVNAKIGNPQYSHTKLQEYKTNNMGIVLQNFLTFFVKRYNGTIQAGVTSTEVSRKNLGRYVAGWFKTNWQQFY
jgi:hypothetical protein